MTPHPPPSDPHDKPTGPAGLRPRDAASLMLIEHRGGVPHVLVGKRSKRHVFYPDSFVFPGGRVDRHDGGVPAAAEFEPEVLEQLMAEMKGRPTQRRARAFALAAIRETFEETGILLGSSEGRPPRVRAEEWNAFFSHGVVPDLSKLAFLCRAITPPRRPRRYDTRFFAAEIDAVAKSLPFADRPTQEFSEARWVSLQEARELPIPAITHTVLDELERRLRRPGGLSAPAPVSFYFHHRRNWVRQTV